MRKIFPSRAISERRCARRRRERCLFPIMTAPFRRRAWPWLALYHAYPMPPGLTIIFRARSCGCTCNAWHPFGGGQAKTASQPTECPWRSSLAFSFFLFFCAWPAAGLSWLSCFSGVYFRDTGVRLSVRGIVACMYCVLRRCCPWCFVAAAGSRHRSRQMRRVV